MKQTQWAKDEIDLPEPDEAAASDVMTGWLSGQTPNRILRIAQALRSGMTINEVHAITKWDKWFLERMANIIAHEKAVQEDGMPQNEAAIRQLKSLGFSDKRLADLAQISEEDVTKARLSYDITPKFKRIDTCAAEFSSATAYMYSTYENTAGSACESDPSDKEKVVILGGGPNRRHWSGN